MKEKIDFKKIESLAVLVCAFDKERIEISEFLSPLSRKLFWIFKVIKKQLVA